MNVQARSNEARKVETALWAMLELDEVGERMEAPVSPAGEAPQMGTGHTVNACYMCSNSATTAGCGTCA
jgi:hypothetical protein